MRNETTTTINEDSSVVLPPEALNALGVEIGAELVTEIVGRSLIICSVEEAQRSRKFANFFQSILTRHRSAYQQLAKAKDLG